MAGGVVKRLFPAPTAVVPRLRDLRVTAAEVLPAPAGIGAYLDILGAETCREFAPAARNRTTSKLVFQVDLRAERGCPVRSPHPHGS